MNLESMVPVIVGGGIGFFSAIGVEALRRHWKAKDNRKRIDRLLQILYEEVEQLGELIDIDLGVVENEEFSFLSGFGGGLGKYDEKIRATISRLQKNRIIFESQAEKLLELPEYLPNSLVRFYSRLQVYCGRMLETIDEAEITELRQIRGKLSVEVNALKRDLKRARTDKSDGT